MPRRPVLVLLTAFALALGMLPASALPVTGTDPLDLDLAKAEECHLIAPADAPVRTGSCPGVRPGAVVLTPAGQCSFNFAFRWTDPEEELPDRTFIGTAGHCLDLDGQSQTWAQGDPDAPVARDGSGDEIGRFVYARLGGGRDFALIEVFAGVDVDPQMCFYGGPTMLDEGPRAGSGFVEHAGQGVVFGDTVPGRTHFVQTFNDPDSVRFYGGASFGDSGSGIIAADTGEAIGVVVSLGVATTGPVRAVRLGPEVELAEQALGLDLELLTADRT